MPTSDGRLGACDRVPRVTAGASLAFLQAPTSGGLRLGTLAFKTTPRNSSMQAVRVALAVASLCLLSPAWAEISTVYPAQRLNPPDGRYPQFGEDVAIDGGF